MTTTTTRRRFVATFISIVLLLPATRKCAWSFRGLSSTPSSFPRHTAADTADTADTAAVWSSSRTTRFTRATRFVARNDDHNDSAITRTTKNDTCNRLYMTTDRVIYTREGDWSDEFIQLRQQMMLPIETVDAMPYPFLPTIQQHQHHQQKQVLYYLLRHGQSTANVANIISSNRTALAYSTMHGLTNLGRQQARDSAAADLYRAIRLLQDGSSAEPAPNPSSDEPATASSQLEQNSHHHRVVFVSSPFARARQTALACRDGLLDIIQRIEKQEEQKNTGMVVSVDSEILLYDELVERWFGRLDGTAVETYAYVWPLDRFNVTHDAFGVESVAAVCTRIQRLMQSLERDLKDNNDNDNDNATNNDSNSNDTRRNSTIHVVLVSHADVLQIAQLYAAQAENVGEFSSFRFQNGEVRAMSFADAASLPDPVPLEKPNRSTRQG